jgi:hypothetical protein
MGMYYFILGMCFEETIYRSYIFPGSMYRQLRDTVYLPAIGQNLIFIIAFIGTTQQEIKL